VPRSSPQSSRSCQVGSSVFCLGQVAQLVEHMTENHGVGGSIPPLAMMVAEGGEG
jgi:hypothetical protein